MTRLGALVHYGSGAARVVRGAAPPAGLPGGAGAVLPLRGRPGGRRSGGAARSPVRRRRRSGALQAAALVALAVAGCTRGPNPAREVRLWAMGREGEVVERLLPEFERRHPGLHVRVQQIPWSAAHEKLLTAFVGRAMPDVFQLGSTWVPELAAIGALAPLDTRLAVSTSARSEDFFLGILDANRIDGTTYGVPWYVDTRLLFYRTDLLAQAGFALPPTD